jgi:hypothetical protein
MRTAITLKVSTSTPASVDPDFPMQTNSRFSPSFGPSAREDPAKTEKLAESLTFFFTATLGSFLQAKF